jgi:hypothetical protein
MFRINFFKFHAYTDTISKNIVAGFSKKSSKEKMKKQDEKAFKKLQELAIFTKVGLLSVTDLKNVIVAVQSELKKISSLSQLRDDSILAAKLCVVLTEELVSDLSIAYMMEEFKSWLCQTKADGESHIQNPTDLSRENKAGFSFIDKIYENENNVRFTDEFLFNLLPKLMLPLARSLAISKSLNVPFDYTRYDAEITRIVMSEIYYSSLKQLGSHFELVPSQMKEGASLVYRSLKHLLSALMKRYDVSESINLFFEEQELPKDQDTQIRVARLDTRKKLTREPESGKLVTKANKFLVHLVGLYLNLKLLRRSFFASVNKILQSPDLLLVINEGFYKGTFDKQILTDQRQLWLLELRALLQDNTIVLTDPTREKIHILISLYQDEKIALAECNKVICENNFDLLAVFNNREAIDTYPNFAGHCLLLTQWPTIISERREFEVRVRTLNPILEYGLVQNFEEYINSKERISPSNNNTTEKGTPPAESSAQSSAMANPPLIHTRQLKEDLKKIVAEEHLDSILTLYGKMSVINNLFKHHKTLYPIKLHFNLEELLQQMPKSTLSNEKEEELAHRAFDLRLSDILMNKLTYIRTKLVKNAPKLLKTSDHGEAQKQANIYINQVRTHLLGVIGFVGLKRDKVIKAEIEDIGQLIYTQIKINLEKQLYTDQDQRILCEVLSLLIGLTLIAERVKLAETINESCMLVGQSGTRHYHSQGFNVSKPFNEYRATIKRIYNVENFEELKAMINASLVTPSLRSEKFHLNSTLFPPILSRFKH